MGIARNLWARDVKRDAKLLGGSRAQTRRGAHCSGLTPEHADFP
jgi:hypothetical protein